MRTNIDIDDKLLKKAMRATGTHTKKAAVEASLHQVVELSERQGILKWFGKVDWDGNLDAMRAGRLPEWEAAQRNKGTKKQKKQLAV